VSALAKPALFAGGVLWGLYVHAVKRQAEAYHVGRMLAGDVRAGWEAIAGDWRRQRRLRAAQRPVGAGCSLGRGCVSLTDAECEPCGNAKALPARPMDQDQWSEEERAEILRIGREHARTFTEQTAAAAAARVLHEEDCSNSGCPSFDFHTSRYLRMADALERAGLLRNAATQDPPPRPTPTLPDPGYPPRRRWL
jgi:hypothetical protein